MAKKYQHVVISYPRRSSMTNNKTRRRRCPFCGEDDTANIIQIHGDYHQCRKCSEYFEVWEECFDEWD